MVIYFYSRHTCVLQKGVCMLVHGNIFLLSPYVCVAEGCVCMLVHGNIFLQSPYVYVSAWYYISTVAIRVCCRRVCVC